jgi:hypothetical protein
MALSPQATASTEGSSFVGALTGATVAAADAQPTTRAKVTTRSEAAVTRLGKDFTSDLAAMLGSGSRRLSGDPWGSVRRAVRSAGPECVHQSEGIGEGWRASGRSSPPLPTTRERNAASEPYSPRFHALRETKTAPLLLALTPVAWSSSSKPS